MRSKAATLVVMLVLLAFPPARGGEKAAAKKSRNAASDLALQAAKVFEGRLERLIARVRPAVVSIDVAGKGPDGKDRAGLGSGVVIDSNGLILTNYHVVGWAKEIHVRIERRGRWPARIVGKDEEGDLALLSVKAGAPLDAVKLGDSDRLRVGETVVAMGDPKGISWDGNATATLGTVTGLHRIGGGVLGGDLFYGDAIQTDAEINPGNSGGPLLDMKGRLVGLNGRIATRFRARTGAVNASVGFAIPVNEIRRFLPLLRAGKKIRHAFLGVRVEPDTVRILQVVKGTPAAKAGLEPGDRLLALDGHELSSDVRLTNLLSTRPAGTVVALRVKRGKQELILTAKLSARPEGIK